jgi:hypothetical protein
MANAYLIGVNLALSSNHRQVLQALSHGLLGINTNVNQVHTSFTRLGTAIGGAFALFTGGVILRGLTSIVDKTKDLSRELTNIRIMQPGVDIDALSRQFQATARQVRGVSQADVAGIYGRSYSLIGPEAAQRAMGPLAQFGAAVGAESGKGFSSEDLAKIAQVAVQTNRIATAGQYDAKKFTDFLDTAHKMMIGTDFRVGFGDLLTMTKRGNLPLSGMSNEGIMGMGMMAQAMGAAQTGTALMSLNQQLLGGQGFSQRIRDEWVRLGMAKEGDFVGGRQGTAAHHLRLPGGITVRGGGSHLGFGGGIVMSPDLRERLRGEMGEDLLGYVANKLIPSMVGAGITDPQKQSAEVYSLYGRGTTQRFMAELIRDNQRLIEERQRLSGAMGYQDATGVLAAHSVPYNIGALDKAWNNLLQTLSGPNSENTIWILQKMTGALEYLTETLARHPTAVTYLAGGLVALAGLVVVGGPIAIALAAGGWLVGGFMRLGSLLGFGGPILLALGVGGILILGLAALSKVLSGDWKTFFADLTEGLRKLLNLTGTGPDQDSPGGFWKRGAPSLQPDAGRTGHHGIGGLWRHHPGTSVPSVQPTSPYHAIPFSGAPYTGGTSVPGVPGPRSDVGGFLPASIRYNNPGAQYPSQMARLYGMEGYGTIGGGHLIAKFPDPEHGLASNMDLFYRNYTGMALGAAGTKWTGGNGFGVPGYDPSMRVTKEMMQNEEFAISLFKAIAKREAGRKSPLTDEQWHKGFELFREHHPFGAAMVPPPKQSNINIDVPLTLDGQRIAHSTMRQMVAGFNSGAGGSRMPDYTSTLPHPTKIALGWTYENPCVPLGI